MIRRPILTIAIASFLVSLSLFVGIVTNSNVQASLFGNVTTASRGFIMPAMIHVDVAKSGDWSYCDYEAPEEVDYQVDMLTETMDTDLIGGDVFYVDFTFENTGNTRLFSSDSECDDVPVINLGTQMDQDRQSLFGDSDHSISGWLSADRIKMQEAYVDPGEEFHISFQSLAPEGDNIYREFFQPVIEDYGWIDEVFALDIEVGTATEEMKDNIQYVTRTAIDAASLSGLEKNLEVDLSEQILYAKFGDIAVWEMQTSTGAWDTPTPPGSYTIFQKQELRIGGEYPHYRMPWWQYWDARGYGIHGLPYLGTDGGAFWQEANDHIGIPVSHGCVRTLPEDAETLYYFTEIGTPIVIHN